MICVNRAGVLQKWDAYKEAQLINMGLWQPWPPEDRWKQGWVCHHHKRLSWHLHPACKPTTGPGGCQLDAQPSRKPAVQTEAVTGCDGVPHVTALQVSTYVIYIVD